jgi:hypothetical protein
MCPSFTEVKFSPAMIRLFTHLGLDENFLMDMCLVSFSIMTVDLDLVTRYRVETTGYGRCVILAVTTTHPLSLEPNRKNKI